MSNPTRCPECNAVRKDRGARFCGYCGADIGPLPAPAAGPHGDVRARFRKLLAHPDLARVLARKPPSSAGLWPPFALGGFGIFWIAMISAMWWRVDNSGLGIPTVDPFGAKEPDVFDYVLPLFGVIGIGMIAGAAWKAWRILSSPLRSYPALVAGERASTGNESAQYFVAIEDESGNRHEFTTTGNLAGMLATGDMGVAYVRGDMLLGFSPLRV